MRRFGRKRAMFAVRGRAHKRRFGLRSLAVFGVLIVFVMLLVLGLGWPSAQQSAKAQVTLLPQKRLFGIGERPVLHLRMAPGPRVSLLQQTVYASTVPEATVDLDGTRTSETAQVTPDGTGYKVTLSDNHVQPKAGTYNVTVTGATNSGQDFKQQASFAWGTMAVNTDKSVYTPGQTVQLQFGVVGNKGNTICNAPLVATVTDPKGQATHVPVTQSDSCHGDSFSNQPDYTASYVTEAVGIYGVSVTPNQAAYAIQTSFKVESKPAVDVTRTSITRLFPDANYGMQLTVHVSQDFAGQVKEELPSAEFKVLSHSAGAVQSQEHGRPVLIWQVSWKAGDTQELSYQFTPPPRSPAFYQTAPAIFTDQAGKVVFAETHGWQFVDDAIIGFVKETEFSIASGSSPNTTTKAVTSTNGNTLILLFAEATNAASDGLGSVSDSAGNAWVKPGSNPNQNPPASRTSGAASEVAMAYSVGASPITTITVTVASGAAPTSAFAFDLIEFSNIDTQNPVDQSASAALADPGVPGPVAQDSPTLSATTCDSPTTAALMRGGDYFCTSPTELVIGMIHSGRSSYVLQTTIGTNAGNPWDSTHTQDMPMSTGGTPAPPCSNALTSCAAGTYVVTTVSGSYHAEWQVTPNSGNAHPGATGLMVFRQAGNTSGGDKQNFFWAH